MNILKINEYRRAISPRKKLVAYEKVYP